jgi:nicotinamide mononucleotide transporter
MTGTLLEWLDRAAFTMLGVPVSWAEVLGDVTGALSVALVARGHIANWPIGLLNNLFWGWLFYRSKLYGDSALQGVFFVLGVYGWVRWARGTSGDAPLPVRRMPARERTFVAGATFAATAIATAWLALGTDSPAPLADASVLTLSLAATWGQADKAIESWWLWIAVDAVSVPLYWSRALYPTALLYVVFGALCVVGLRRWGLELAEREAAAAEKAAS